MATNRNSSMVTHNLRVTPDLLVENVQRNENKTYQIGYELHKNAAQSLR